MVSMHSATYRNGHAQDHVHDRGRVKIARVAHAHVFTAPVRSAIRQQTYSQGCWEEDEEGCTWLQKAGLIMQAAGVP